MDYIKRLFCFDLNLRRPTTVADLLPSSLAVGETPSRLLTLLHPGQYPVKKRLAIFPSPAGMSLTKLSLAGARIYRPSFRDTKNERFGLVIAKIGSVNSGTGEFV
jgi:hypothetical protein